MTPRRVDLKVNVTEHAKIRARQRFPGFKLARIVDEVHAALVAGRFSSHKPTGLVNDDHPEGHYAWTEDGERIYGIAFGETMLHVRTVMRKDEPQ